MIPARGGQHWGLSSDENSYKSNYQPRLSFRD